MRKSKNLCFTPVAMFFIILGAVFSVLGGYMLFTDFFAVYMIKSLAVLMGGVIIMVLGYIQLELGLIRKK